MIWSRITIGGIAIFTALAAAIAASHRPDGQFVHGFSQAQPPKFNRLVEDPICDATHLDDLATTESQNSGKAGDSGAESNHDWTDPYDGEVMAGMHTRCLIEALNSGSGTVEERLCCLQTAISLNTCYPLIEELERALGTAVLRDPSAGNRTLANSFGLAYAEGMFDFFLEALKWDPEVKNRRLFLESAKSFFTKSVEMRDFLWVLHLDSYRSISRTPGEKLEEIDSEKAEAILAERRGKILHTLQLMRLTDLELRPEIDEAFGEIKRALKKG